MDPFAEQAGHVGAGRRGRREVDDHLAVGGGELGDVGSDGDAADDLRRRARVDRGDQLEEVVGGDGTAGRRSHPSTSAAHADPDLHQLA